MQKTYKDSDSLLGSDAAEHAYRKFYKHKLPPRLGKSVDMTIRFGADLTDVVVSIKNQLSNRGKKISERGAGNSTTAKARQEKSALTFCKSHRAESTLQEAFQRLKNFF